MKSLLLLAGAVCAFALAPLCAQDRFALVIGNGAYKDKQLDLDNPLNDANDVGAALEGVGFKVNLLKNASCDEIENGVVWLKDNLSRSKDACGFFFFAGHGVQFKGQNFLLPSDVEIKMASAVEAKAFNVQILLGALEEAKNQLNIVVLDACRNNPRNWSRSLSRGLAVVSGQPVGSIVVYSTSEGKEASDGTGGRNSTFTGQLLKNLTVSGLEVYEIFRRTNAGVFAESKGEQNPAIYTQFHGTMYFSGGSSSAPPPAAAVVAAAPAAAPSNAGGVRSGSLSGKWSGVVSYALNGAAYQDRYEVELDEDNSCFVTITTRDGQKQSGEGSWEVRDDRIFKFDVVFFDAVIPRLAAIHWTSVFSLGANGRSLTVNVRPEPDAGLVGLTFNRARK